MIVLGCLFVCVVRTWLQVRDSNSRLSGYEPDTLPLRQPAVERGKGIEPLSNRWQRFVLPLNYLRVERVYGIKPYSSAWKAEAQPLDQIRINRWYHYPFFPQSIASYLFCQ
jgi:hypothetical protein